MRIHFSLTGTGETVPFGYLPLLVGRLHKWLGLNELHDHLSLYSIGTLHGGKANGNGIMFRRGARFFISFYDDETAKKVVNAAMADRNVFYGMQIEEIRIQNPPPISINNYVFWADSPILTKRHNPDGSITHLTYRDEEAKEILSATLRTKLKKAGLPANSATIDFDRNYPKAKTKLIDYNGVKNKASMCPVVIEAAPEIIQFVWETGAGHSTGAGFGALR